LQTTRSELKDVQFQMEMLQDAMMRSTVVQFPTKENAADSVKEPAATPAKKINTA
jgi:hypothetical protein